MSKKHPTSIRLSEEDQAWLDSLGTAHPRGRTGVIMDALKLYRDHLDQQESAIFDAVVCSGETHE